MKLIDLVRKAEQQLLNAGVVFGHGTDNAWDEAAWITLWTLGLPLDTDLSPESEAAAQVVAAAGVEQVEQGVQQRIARQEWHAHGERLAKSFRGG